MLALVFAAVCAATPAQRTEAGPLTLVVSSSESATVFHVVDQLSAWSPYTHKQYLTWFKAQLTPEDHQALAEHARIRKRLGYGVLDTTFYAPSTLEQAVAAARIARQLTPEDLSAEERILRRFADRVRAFSVERSRRLTRFSSAISSGKETLAAFAQSAAAFFGSGAIEVPVFLVPSTGKNAGGGGYNGGRLVLELGEDPSVEDVLLHEVWHAFAEGKKQQLIDAAARIPGLDYETLSESFAYAVSPGLHPFSNDTDDWLTSRVHEARGRQTFFRDPYVRFTRCALALRPTLADALRAGRNFEETLPAALAVIRGEYSVAAAEERTPRGYFVFGGQAKPVATKLAAGQHDAWSRPLVDEALGSLGTQIRPWDVVVLLVDARNSIPSSFDAVLGAQAKRVRAEMQKTKHGSSFVNDGRGRVVVLWGDAPEKGLSDPEVERRLTASNW